jgi:hypothetical protein
LHHSGRPHTIDSLINGKTRGAITAFLGDRGIIAAAGISPALTAEIAKAKGEGWSRPVAPKRAYATAKDIAPKVEAVKQNAWSRFWSKVLAVPSTAGAATWGVVSNIPAANDAAQPPRERRGDHVSLTYTGFSVFIYGGDEPSLRHRGSLDRHRRWNQEPGRYSRGGQKSGSDGDMTGREMHAYSLVLRAATRSSRSTRPLTMYALTAVAASTTSAAMK